MTAHISVTAEPILIKLKIKNYYLKGITISHVVGGLGDYPACHCPGYLSFLFFIHTHGSHQLTDVDDLYVM